MMTESDIKIALDEMDKKITDFRNESENQLLYAVEKIVSSLEKSLRLQDEKTDLAFKAILALEDKFQQIVSRKV